MNSPSNSADSEIPQIYAWDVIAFIFLCIVLIDVWIWKPIRKKYKEFVSKQDSADEHRLLCMRCQFARDDIIHKFLMFKPKNRENYEEEFLAFRKKKENILILCSECRIRIQRSKRSTIAVIKDYIKEKFFRYISVFFTIFSIVYYEEIASFATNLYSNVTDSSTYDRILTDILSRYSLSETAKTKDVAFTSIVIFSIFSSLIPSFEEFLIHVGVVISLLLLKKYANFRPTITECIFFYSIGIVVGKFY